MSSGGSPQHVGGRCSQWEGVPAHCGYSIRKNVCEAGRDVDEKPSCGGAITVRYYWTLHYTTRTSGGHYTNNDDPCMLGLDYLLESHVCLDFGEMRMEVHMEEGAAAEGERQYPCGSCQDYLCATEDEDLVGKTLVRPDDEQVRVLVANLGDEERQIPAGAAVGSCEAVDLSHEAPGSGLKRWQLPMACQHTYSLSRRPCEPDCQHCSPKEESVKKCRRTVVQPDMKGSYEHLEEAQHENPDIGPILKLMEQNTNKPAWEQR
ncbi:hypothetical protein O3P69_004947 [Scylla paramamosain]|uniref:Uncharacterized protein n=1 Tax=Scylla paramamosain TaxID=85552 RepID=A0AAW0UAK9_SCYPA